MGSVCIEKARHIHVGIRSHIERAFVVNIIGHAHYTVIACHQLLPKNIDIVAKFILTKHCVDGGQHERCARHRLAQSIKAMHRAGRGLHDIVQRQRHAVQTLLAKPSKMLFNLGAQVVANDGNLLGIVCHKDANEPINQPFAVNVHQGFGHPDTFFC